MVSAQSRLLSFAFLYIKGIERNHLILSGYLCIVISSFYNFVQAEVVSKLSSKSGLLETMRGLLDRTCPMLVDAQCVQILTEKVCDC